MTWSQMFKEIEANKERLNIIDYSVSQTTLDQVRYSMVHSAPAYTVHAKVPMENYIRESLFFHVDFVPSFQ